MNATIPAALLQQISDCLNAALAGRCDSRSAAPYFVAIANAIEDAKEEAGAPDAEMLLRALWTAHKQAVDFCERNASEDSEELKQITNQATSLFGKLRSRAMEWEDASSTAPEGE